MLKAFLSISELHSRWISWYRQTSFYCTSLYCASQTLCLLKIEGFLLWKLFCTSLSVPFFQQCSCHVCVAFWLTLAIFQTSSVLSYTIFHVTGIPWGYHGFSSRWPQGNKYCNRVSHIKFWFPSACSSYIYTMLYSIKCAIALCLKTVHTWKIKCTCLSKYMLKNANHQLSLHQTIIFLQ